jgi:hypothetical protein
MFISMGFFGCEISLLMTPKNWVATSSIRFKFGIYFEGKKGLNLPY